MSDTCFFLNNQQISFDVFYQDILSVRNTIATHNIYNVMLFHEDSYQFTVLFFALILEGKQVYLPPNKQMGILENIATSCDASMGDIALEKIPFIRTSIKQVINSVSGGTIQHLFSLFSRPTSGQITFYTSGSTGEPKAILKNCQQLICELETLSNVFQLNKVDVIVSTVSHQHIYGLLFKILLPLRLGKIIVNKTFEYPEHIKSDLGEFLFNPLTLKPKNIMLISSPAHLERLVLDNVLSEYAKHYYITFSSGGLLSKEASQSFSQQMGKAPVEIFGSTETGGIAWRCGQPKQDTPWQVFPNISYKVQEDTHRLEILSPYIDLQPYLTDDKISPVDATHFNLDGRIDRTVKIEEKRVNLDQIEQYLLTHPWITDVKVFVIKQKSIVVERMVLACVLIVAKEANKLLQEQGKRALNELLKQYLLNNFERICLPKKWRYIDKFPYNPQGKLVLNELESLFD